MKKILTLLGGALFLAACSPEPTASEGLDFLEANLTVSQKDLTNTQNIKATLDPPILTCGTASENSMELIVTSGTTGAGGGFDIQWQLVSNDVDPVNWEEEHCSSGFASNKNNDYALDPGQSFSVFFEEIGTENFECTPELACGQVYAFRVRAKNEGGQGLKKSDWSNTYFCTPCELECEGTYMWGDTPLNSIDTEAKWGWAHSYDVSLDGSSRTFDLYNGAAHNDTKKGKDLGDITVSVDPQGAVSLQSTDNVTITHLYVSDATPTQAAPGLFGKTGNQGDADQDGKFWIIVKADVCN